MGFPVSIIVSRDPYASQMAGLFLNISRVCATGECVPLLGFAPLVSVLIGEGLEEGIRLTLNLDLHLGIIFKGSPNGIFLFT